MSKEATGSQILKFQVYENTKQSCSRDLMNICRGLPNKISLHWNIILTLGLLLILQTPQKVWRVERRALPIMKASVLIWRNVEKR